MSVDSDIDILHLHCVGGRLNPEQSHALPADHYGDPSRIVRLQSERNCGGCLYDRPGKRGSFCGKGQQHGKRCEFYRMKKK